MSDSDKTVSGLDPNVAAALTYLLGWVTGLLFLATEPQNRFVRFHAMQSSLVFGSASIAFFVCVSMIPLVGMLLSIVIFYGSAVLWLLLMFKAYQGRTFKLPIAGEMAEKRI